MKKYIIKRIALGLALFFCAGLTACNTSLMEKSSQETLADVEVTFDDLGNFMEQIMSREVSGADSEYVLKLDFADGYKDVVHNSTDVMRISGTSAEVFKKRTLSVTGIPLYTKVAFKVTVLKGGEVLFESVSRVITVGVTKTLKMNLDNAEFVAPVFTMKSSSNAEAFFQVVSSKNLMNIDNTKSLLEIYGEDTKKIKMTDFCMDNDGNLYVLSDKTVTRYKASDYEKSETAEEILRSPSADDSVEPCIYYDYASKSLYLFEKGDGKINVIKLSDPANNNGLTEESKKKVYSTEEVISGCSKYDFAVYGDRVYILYQKQDGEYVGYYISTGLLSDGGSITDIEQKTLLTDAAPADIEPGTEVLLQEYFYKEETVNFERFSFTDFAVTEEGVFILAKDFCYDWIKNNTHYSRGALVKLRADLTDPECYGWADTMYKIHLRNQLKFTNYIPVSIDNGFYGPEKFLAIKPKKLVFADDGSWHYVSKDSENRGWVKSGDKYNIKQENHVVVVDLNEMSWISKKTEAEFFTENTSCLGYDEYGDCEYISSWVSE